MPDPLEGIPGYVLEGLQPQRDGEPPWDTAPWETDPDMDDLLAIMRPRELEFWKEGGQTLEVREAFLAAIEARWKRWREALIQKQKPFGPQELKQTLSRQTDTLDDLFDGMRMDVDRMASIFKSSRSATEQPSPDQASGIKDFLKHLHFAFRVVALGAGIACLNFSWTMIDHGEFLAAYVLLAAAVVFTSISVYGWEGIPHYPQPTKAIKSGLLIVITLVAVYFGFLFWKIKGDKPWTNVWNISRSSAPKPTPIATEPKEAAKTSEERIYADLSAEQLVAFYKKYSSAQADEATKTYIGKWIKIPLAVVADVDREKNFGDKPDTIRLAATVDAPNGWVLYSVIATFSDQRWMDRALILNKDEKITIIGKIQRVIPPGIILEECELVEGKGDESR